ncbi:Crp/Fnr family transcriptional regulator [Pedobacter chinensis]|uniref:Crp/Fnr family transcriptional regulator n=1 Tax=Pedobacter chinensis TaxID=2282421 RepID=A0A369PZP4_9SPHI|nr:Crp/Fnr family transcriptional regulator [Pedobacter chinensis]RDC58113.1 Crp/Fnr family transcriptional regulator [Pedobacter chinensis]
MSVIKDDSEHLIEFLNNIHPLGKEVIALTKQETFKVFLKKNEVLPCPIKQGEDGVFFILEGIVRGFIVDNGRDITTSIMEENYLIGHVRNSYPDKPVYQEQFQALEDSKLLVVSHSLIDQLYLQYPDVNILGRKLLAIHFHMSKEGAILSRIPSAEARYNQFRKIYPNLKNRVPVKFLATYLGMRIETLSRIRKKEK